MSMPLISANILLPRSFYYLAFLTSAGADAAFLFSPILEAGRAVNRCRYSRQQAASDFRRLFIQTRGL